MAQGTRMQALPKLQHEAQCLAWLEARYVEIADRVQGVITWQQYRNANLPHMRRSGYWRRRFTERPMI